MADRIRQQRLQRQFPAERLGTALGRAPSRRWRPPRSRRRRGRARGSPPARARGSAPAWRAHPPGRRPRCRAPFRRARAPARSRPRRCRSCAGRPRRWWPPSPSSPRWHCLLAPARSGRPAPPGDGGRRRRRGRRRVSRASEGLAASGRTRFYENRAAAAKDRWPAHRLPPAASRAEQNTLVPSGLVRKGAHRRPAGHRTAAEGTADARHGLGRARRGHPQHRRARRGHGRHSEPPARAPSCRLRRRDDAARRCGATMRRVLGARRLADVPVTSRDIARTVMTAHGLDPDDPTMLQVIRKRVGACLWKRKPGAHARDVLLESDW